jgi:hypothetical protein
MRRVFLGVILAACGGNSTTFYDAGGVGEAGPDGSGGPTDGSVIFQESGPTDSSSQEDAPTMEVDYVYAHSPDTLYKVDPVAKTMTTIAPFNGCTSVIDLAIDANQNAWVTTFDGVYTLDLTTAVCTLIASGSYPNSLSFVPAGTLDPSVEALVGYFGSTYVRIDPKSGAITNVGSLTNGYSSSGDIVSVKGGGTFLTVNGNGCGDCLLQVNPKTGAMIQNYGTVNHASVFGIAYWASSSPSRGAAPRSSPPTSRRRLASSSGAPARRRPRRSRAPTAAGSRSTRAAGSDRGASTSRGCRPPEGSGPCCE